MKFYRKTKIKEINVQFTLGAWDIIDQLKALMQAKRANTTKELSLKSLVVGVDR